MARAEKSMVVHVPVGRAFRWWTSYDQFPEFLDGVLQVHQEDGGTQRWEVELAGRRQEWRTEVAAEAERRVRWRAVSGGHAEGAVELKPVEGGRTLVTLVLDYEPEHEHDAEGAAGMVDRLVMNSLERFRAYAEPRENRRLTDEDEPAPLGAQTVPGPEGELGGPLEPEAGDLPFSDRDRRHGAPMLVREDGGELLDEVDEAEPTRPVRRDPERPDMDENDVDNTAEWSRT